MTSKSQASDFWTTPEYVDEELRCYMNMFEAAFDELHDAVMERVKTPGQYIGPHHDYPIASELISGFPHFSEAGFYNEKSPRDYVGTVRSPGLVGIISGHAQPDTDFPKSVALLSFLRTHEIGKRLRFKFTTDEEVPGSTVYQLVSSAVERYLHLYGADSQVEAKRRTQIIASLIFGTVFRKLPIRLLIPIALTNFDVSHFRLTDSTYIIRIPKKLQLARARLTPAHTGAVKMVVGAATHAIVSNGWSIEADDIFEVSRSLGRASPNALDAADSFFGALRIVTGIDTGYAQVIWMPKQWALDYFCDLPPVRGTTLRRYPDKFDDYGWVENRPTVSAERLVEVRRVYQSIIDNQAEGIRLAVNRLNGCLTRIDPADAILDGTIGLELLLGDEQNQSLSYKLRLRAAALAILHGNPSYPAQQIATNVKRLYEARSAIVHGRKKKRTKRASEPTETKNETERSIASDLLRFVLNVLLINPEYQDPMKIDEGLLLRGDDIVERPKETRRQKKKPANKA